MSSVEDDRLTKKLGCLIRIGQVVKVDPQKHTVRVMFEAEDEVSYDLPVLVRNTCANHDYSLPDVGDDVLCLFLPEGPEDGFVLGSFYAGEVTTPINNEDIRCVRFQDDTMVSYNRASHELDVVIEGTHIHADRKIVTITTPNQVNVNTKDVNVNSTGNIAMNAGGDVAIQASGAVTINGSSISIG